MSQAHNTAPVAAAYTFAHSSSSRNFSELHTLYARDDNNKDVDMITVITSIAGVLVSIIGLILGYIYWKRGVPGTSRAAASSPYTASQSSNTASPIASSPSTLHPLTASVNFNVSINYGSVPPPSLPYATPMLIVEGNRISIHPTEPEPRFPRCMVPPCSLQRQLSV